MSERFRRIAVECGKIIGFSEPKVEDELYSLTIGHTLVLLKPMAFDFEGEGILAVAEIGEFIEKIPDEVLGSLLAANVGFSETGGATLGVTMCEDNLLPDGSVDGDSSVVLSKVFSSGIDDGQKLCDQLNLFVDKAEEWQEKIKVMFQESAHQSLEIPSAAMMQV